MAVGGGGGCGGRGGGGRVVVVMVVVMAVMASPTLCQTSNGGGVFHILKSCGASVQLSNLVVNNTMWLRGAREVTLTTLENISALCVLPPNTTHKVTVGAHLAVHAGGAAGEEEEREESVCYFTRYAVFHLPGGILMVSCLADKSQAEVEMLGAEESSSSAPSRVRPQDRALDPPSTPDTTHHTPTTLPPQSSHEPLVAATTLEPTTTGTGADHLDTTLMVTGAASSTKLPPLTDDRAMETTPREETTEMPEGQMTDGTDGSTRSATSGSSSTQETGLTEKLTPPAGTQPPETKNENISVRELTIKNDVRLSGEDTPDDHNDQVIYLAGAGAAVAALVLCVVVVACVAHHRRRKANAKINQDLFISGGYKGSMNSLSGSQGAYLNAHVMYSGAEPEFVESFELEERMLNSNVSYSSHDIPKCLKEP